MGTVLTPILSATKGTDRAYNVGMAETYSWVPIVGDALGRPMYARASYITNFSDMSIYLSASELSIGAVTIKDNNSGLNADVVNIPGYGSGLQVLTQDLESTIDDVTIGDKQGHYADVVPELSALRVNVTNLNDSANLDAFGRLRVSEPKTLVDAKHLYDKLPLLFVEKLSGTATTTFSANDSMVVMATEATGDFAIRQSRYHFNYQPGKSLQAFFTGKLHPQVGITKRMGLYQSLSASPSTPSDGIYLEVTENGPCFHITKTEGTPHSMSFPQSAWNVDKLDGTGPSGLTVAMSAAQIFVIDYEWLSLGRVRFGFMQSGKTYYAHYVNHVNDLDRPYITSPNQPIRYEIIQTGATPGSMHHICSTVMVEGGEDVLGKPISVSNAEVTSIGTTAKTLVAVRLKKAAHDSSVIVKGVEALNTGGNAGKYQILLNPTIVSGSFTWTDLPNTAIQYSTGGAEVSGGYILFQSFVGTGQGGASTSNSLPVPGEISKIGINVDDVSDIIVLVGAAFASNATTDMVGIMNLLERS
jgi:hypothetical protein